MNELRDYVYAIMFASVVAAAAYIVFSRTKSALGKIISKSATAILLIGLAVSALISVFGGLGVKNTLSIIFLFVSVVILCLKDEFVLLLEVGKIKMDAKKSNLIDEIASVIAALFTLVTLILVFGFSFYTLIFFVALAILFYYLNTIIYKADYGKNTAKVILYDLVISFVLASSISAIAFTTTKTVFALFVLLAFAFFYVSDFFKYGRLYIQGSELKDGQVMDIFGISLYYAGIVLLALSIAVILF